MEVLYPFQTLENKNEWIQCLKGIVSLPSDPFRKRLFSHNQLIHCQYLQYFIVHFSNLNCLITQHFTLYTQITKRNRPYLTWIWRAPPVLFTSIWMLHLSACQPSSISVSISVFLKCRFKSQRFIDWINSKTPSLRTGIKSSGRWESSYVWIEA